MKMIESNDEPDLVAMLGARDLLYREAPAVARVLITEAFRFVREHPELKGDDAGRAHAFLDVVRDLPVTARGEETTVGRELFRVGSGGVEVLRPLLALVDGQTSLRSAMQLERDRLTRAIRSIEELEAATA